MSDIKEQIDYESNANDALGEIVSLSLQMVGGDQAGRT